MLCYGTIVLTISTNKSAVITITSDTLGQQVPDNETGQLELLGVKLIGKLNSFQAREVTQFEVGDPHWKSDIQYLQTGGFPYISHVS